MSLASAGDGDAFGQLVASHRGELHLHCYRMLGSLQDAEDALQDALLAAWRGFEGYEGRSTLRTWLYRVTTNVCLNAQRQASRRPPKAWDIPNVDPPAPTNLGDVTWLEPYPDRLLAGVINAPLGPDARAERSEAIALAFVTALQALPRRQVAVVILRDVLGFRSREVAEILGCTVEAVNSLLKRARTGLRVARGRNADVRPPPAAGSRAEDAVVSRFVHAWEAADVPALVTLLTEDVSISMPPMPLEYRGRELVGRFCASIFDGRRRFDLVPTRANGQPAFGAYLRGDDGLSHATGLYVLTVAGARICAMARFENAVLPWFRLPQQLRVR